MLSVRRHYPKRVRFTENLGIYLSPPAPNSLLQSPSNFGATASHWLLYFLLFFFFSDFKPDGCVEPYAWRRVCTFCIWQPTSQYPVGSFLLIPKSPQAFLYPSQPRQSGTRRMASSDSSPRFLCSHHGSKIFAGYI